MALGEWLRGEGYSFVTSTPATHARVLARPQPPPDRATLRDIFGFSRPFAPGALAPTALSLLEASGELRRTPAGLISGVRFSSLGGELYAHSAFPTDAPDSVFFGPDTYRYARLLGRLGGRFARAIDIGAGSGAGLLSIRERLGELVLRDINARALRLASVNASLAGARVTLSEGSLFDGVRGTFELIASNPPFLVDERERRYRHGGDRGIALSLAIVEQGLARLSPGGTLALYTGTPIVEGRDLLADALAPLLEGFKGASRYEVIDEDVFSEELERPAYQDVERISVVSLVATRSG